MSPATLAQEIEHLDAAQQNAVALFVRFLAAQPRHSVPLPNPPVPLFGVLKDKIGRIAPDFDEPLEDFAAYMQCAVSSTPTSSFGPHKETTS